ncbi:MAG: DUF1987 domain-containing protein [Cyclobacteriaceae bacterium]|nr:DUF1987 domain-containing protein [Cyclobacteriaceae bacterium HetDA_MAG_MS6]
MNNFYQLPTAKTAQISVNYTTGTMELRGASNPENAITFFKPTLEAVKSFNETDRRDVTANFALQYFNTSSARCIYLLLETLNELRSSGKKVTINWFYEEDDFDMLETGQDFENLMDMSFSFKEVKTSGDDLVQII